MKNLIYLFCFLSVSFPILSHAETIYTYKDGVLPDPRNTSTGGQKLSGESCSAGGGAPHKISVDDMYVSRVESLVLTIHFTDANSSTSYLDIYCRSTNATLYSGVYADLPVIVSTAPAGISTVTTSRIRWVSTTGGAPGSSNFTLTFSNLPDTEINCWVECGAGYEAADVFDVYARGITP